MFVDKKKEGKKKLTGQTMILEAPQEKRLIVFILFYLVRNKLI